MEVPGGHQNKLFVLLSEFLGTCFVMIFFNWSSVTGHTAGCLGFCVMMMFQIFGPISGGHFNPAVTFGMLIKAGSKNWLRNTTLAFMMIIFQCMGAGLGCLICFFGFEWTPSDTKNIPDVGYHIAQLCPSGGCNESLFILRKIFFAEALATFVYMSNIILIVKHNGSGSVSINAFCIGITLFLALAMTEGITGGCINPAIGFVQTIFQSMANGMKYPNADRTSYMNMGVYIGGPFFGAWMAAFWNVFAHTDALAYAKEITDPEYEKLLAQGHYQPRKSLATKVREESERRAAQAAEKQRQIQIAVYKEAIEPLWDDFDKDGSGALGGGDLAALGLMLFDSLGVPIDADNFDDVIDAARDAKAALDGEPEGQRKEEMDIDYVAELFVFIATGG